MRTCSTAWCGSRLPTRARTSRAALADFALTLERELPGFQMVHVLADEEKLTAFLPPLTELAEQRRALIVIDNAESLLTEGGRWRDGRWGQVTGALCAHHGLGRLVVTSRRVPADAGGLRVLAVDALSADEALLLARELPHLNRLVRGQLPGVERFVSRRLALRVLTIAQGHPKLLELADGQAADPEKLAALVAAGDQAWQEQGGLPDGFFTAGHAPTSAGDHLHVLGAWTRTVADGLPPGERFLFWFLCCLEEADRERAVLDGNWADSVDQARPGRPAPALGQALTAIVTRGLTAVLPEANSKAESYAVHPGVAAAGRAQAGAAVPGRGGRRGRRVLVRLAPARIRGNRRRRRPH